jgi:hypothetical protein
VVQILIYASVRIWLKNCISVAEGWWLVGGDIVFFFIVLFFNFLIFFIFWILTCRAGHALTRPYKLISKDG